MTQNFPHIIGRRRFKLNPKENKGAWAMTAAEIWNIFVDTGLPEAYNMYCKLREEEGRGSEMTA